jgi:ribonucleotide monophosphatase NagD (HAD superfamily)
VAALEYASGKVAQVVGKPSPEFFRLALEELGVPPSRVLVVGDDPENDCGGGQRVGCRGAVVRTGKFDAAALVRQAIAPDLILDSVAALDPDAVNP